MKKNCRTGLMAVINAIMLEKSCETAEHADRLAQYAAAIGRELGLTESDLLDLEMAAVLHDIGKMSVEERVLLKEDALTPEEWVSIRKHPEVGYRIAQATPELRRIADDILSHHERWDGTGYPRGLRGEEIPLLARIITLVDAYDAMISRRPYRLPLSVDEAKAELRRCAGSQFDPFLTRLFLEKVLTGERREIFSGCAAVPDPQE